MTKKTGISGTFQALTRFTAPPALHAQCELCAAELRDAHNHLFEPNARRLSCACERCSMLFPEDGSAVYRRVVSRAELFSDVVLEEGDFENLDIPVRFAFLSPSVVHDKVFVTYPNQAGAVEASLPMRAWSAVVEAHPSLRAIEPELEGLLIDYIEGRARCFRASVDVCHRIVGLLRAGSHGVVAWDDIHSMLRTLDGAARV